MNNLKQNSIAIIIPDFDYGGEEKRVVYFANNYIKFFKKVYLFAPKGKSTQLLDSRIKHIVLTKYNFLYIFPVLYCLKVNKIQFLQGHKRTTLPYLWLSEKLLGTKSVFNFDNIYLNANSIFKYITPKYILYLSDIIKNFYLPYYRYHINETINMGGEFYDKNPITCDNDYRYQSFLTHKFVILSLGRLSNQKNHKLLFQALSKINFNNYTCLIAGEGPLKEELVSLANDLGLEKRVQFIGHQSDVANLLNNADFIVQSSLFEGFPNALIEAASVGLPIIATNVGSTESIVCKNGILVGSNNTDQLASAIEAMITNFQVYRLEAENFRNSNYFKQFHKSVMLENYLSFYKSLLP